MEDIIKEITKEKLKDRFYITKDIKIYVVNIYIVILSKIIRGGKNVFNSKGFKEELW